MDPEAVQGLRVLVVEGSMVISVDLERIIKELGCYIVGSCATVKDALKIINTSRVHLALVEIRLLGEETGLPVVGQLINRNIPFALLTRYFENEECPQPSNHLFVNQPFTKEKIRETISALAAKAKR